jgi:hypothetical protein
MGRTNSLLGIVTNEKEVNIWYNNVNRINAGSLLLFSKAEDIEI